MAFMSAFQAEDTGSIPVTRSAQPLTDSGFVYLLASFAIPPIFLTKIAT